MARTEIVVMNFGDILKKAKSGKYKLPAFQRKWKWTTKQVMTFYDSLRLGYPIGAFLFLNSEDGEKLAPRKFYGTGKLAESNQKYESLVLDGQQRITAGISICFGLDDGDGSEYYISIDEIARRVRDKRINLADQEEVKTFCDNLEFDDGYLIPKRKTKDRGQFLSKAKLLWTGFLMDDNILQLDEILEQQGDKEVVQIVKNVVRQFMKPNMNIQVPAIVLKEDFDLSGVSKVFSTINSTGKLLTPFELVVAILYPSGISLEDDIAEYKSKFTYYANMDKNGEVLLQTIALLASKSPKKSDLPKNIDEATYHHFALKAAEILDKLGYFLTNSLGAGLNVTDKLIPYDAIFAPMAISLDYINQSCTTHHSASTARTKLKRWFVATAISQRYQEGIHNKQQNDLKEVNAWIDDDNSIPAWIKDVAVTVAIKNASPSGAIGKLFLCLLNSKNPKDPLTNEEIGFREKIATTEIHHIFPTKWMPKALVGYQKEKVDSNLAFNTMFLYSKTNADWLNFDPKDQVAMSLSANNSNREQVEEIFKRQLISLDAITTLEKPVKNVADYEAFIHFRYLSFVQLLKGYSILEAKFETEYPTEPESPSILNDDGGNS